MSIENFLCAVTKADGLYTMQGLIKIYAHDLHVVSLCFCIHLIVVMISFTWVELHLLKLLNWMTVIRVVLQSYTSNCINIDHIITIIVTLEERDCIWHAQLQYV